MTQAKPMTKSDLVYHILGNHKTLIWPNTVTALKRWTYEELVKLHAEMHEEGQ